MLAMAMVRLTKLDLGVVGLHGGWHGSGRVEEKADFAQNRFMLLSVICASTEDAS